MILSSATRLRRTGFAIFALLVVLQIEGCYYMQAIRGHTDLMSRRQPVPEVLSDESAAEDLKAKLALVQEARDFAVTELGLPDNDSYRLYADLERDYVVWNVFAAPEFSLEPKTWCYPVAGCVAYRGYFKEADAIKMKERLESEGFDVMVGGVAAYSTLGRFDDPVLNTMMRWSEVDLVATMFHELAHQALYIKGDSTFNESFATAVAGIGIAKWLEHTGELDRLANYRQYRKLRSAMFGLVSEAKVALDDAYAETVDGSKLAEVDPDRLRAAKADILERLSKDAQALVDADGRGRSNWLALPLNNARLISLNLYERWVDAFNSIFERCEREFDCYYEQSRILSEMEPAERQAVLAALTS